MLEQMRLTGMERQMAKPGFENMSSCGLGYIYPGRYFKCRLKKLSRYMEVIARAKKKYKL